MADPKGVRRRPATPPPIRIRRNVARLPAGDPIITFYGRAVEEMRSKPIADPTSWRYQAAIHDYPPPGSDLARRRAEDPFAVSTDVLPSNAEQTRFWKQCQHSSWFFLPWHRMYLHHFERMIMGHVARLGGPSDWALPYWDYSASTADALLPLPFCAATLGDGTANAQFDSRLFINFPERSSDANLRRAFATAADTDTSVTLSSTQFEPSGASNEFGGPRRRFHDPGPAGSLEATPHGSMHVAASGTSARGFMGSFVTAPLDPIFWLHHCNIDRLWKAWRRGASTHTDPTNRAWLDERFDFHDASGAIVTMTSSEVLNTRAAPLSYAYDDEP